MIQIVYRSRATAKLGPDGLDALLSGSRVRNERDAVTGLLLYDGRRFLQAIEGPDQAIDACFDRIARDGRHRAIEVVLRDGINARQFGSFAMAAMTPGSTSKDAFVTEIKQRLEDVRAPHLQALFIGFAVLA